MSGGGDSALRWKRLDQGTVVVLAQRVWQAAAGLVTLACIAHFLSPVEQGYYYTFASLAALQMILDMGLSTVLIQAAAHEFAGQAWGSRGEVVGPEPERFLALLHKSIRWYGMAAGLFLAAYPAGVAFLAGAPDGLSYNWHGAWFTLVVATALGLFFLPVLAVVEGSGQVAEVYLLRLVQSVAGAAVVWVTLAAGGGLYAVAMMPAVGILVAGVWLTIYRPRLIVQALKSSGNGFHWRAEIWPMQWRIGVSWLCGYFLMQMHTPLLFRTQNPVVAGQMGVTMTVASMLSLLAMSWMTSRTPALARAVGMRDWLGLDHVFRQAFGLSLLAFGIGAAGFMMMRVALEWTTYGVRFLPIVETAVLLLAIFLSHVTGLFAVYLRAHRREPFMWPSVIGAVVTAAGAVWAAPRWGSAGIVAVLVAVNTFFGMPVAIWLWVRMRRAWHMEPTR